MTIVESVILALGTSLFFIVVLVLWIIFAAPEEHLSPDALFLRKRFRRSKNKRRKSR